MDIPFPLSMDNNPSSSDSGGLLNVGRRSIRRLTHAVKRKRGSRTAVSTDAPAVKAPEKNTASSESKLSESKFCERKCSFRRDEGDSKKCALPGVTKKQEQTTGSAGSVDQGASAQRRNRGRKTSVKGTNKVISRSLMSWPFKRSHGKLDLQSLPSSDGWASRRRGTRSNWEKAGAKINVAIKTEANEQSDRGTREEGTSSDNGGHRVSWKDAEVSGEDGAHRRTKKRRRRRKSQSDADDSLLHIKNPKQARVVATGLCTPKRPRQEEQSRRCKPKKLAVTKEEFLSLKKKLEWELTFNLYCRQKQEFMEINKRMYESDDNDARA